MPGKLDDTRIRRTISRREEGLFRKRKLELEARAEKRRRLIGVDEDEEDDRGEDNDDDLDDAIARSNPNLDDLSFSSSVIDARRRPGQQSTPATSATRQPSPVDLNVPAGSSRYDLQPRPSSTTPQSSKRKAPLPSTKTAARASSVYDDDEDNFEAPLPHSLKTKTTPHRGRVESPENKANKPTAKQFADKKQAARAATAAKKQQKQTAILAKKKAKPKTTHRQPKSKKKHSRKKSSSEDETSEDEEGEVDEEDLCDDVSDDDEDVREYLIVILCTSLP